MKDARCVVKEGVRTPVDIWEDTMPFSARRRMRKALHKLRVYTATLSWCDACGALTERRTASVLRPGRGRMVVCSDHLHPEDRMLCPAAGWTCGFQDEGCMATHAGAPECLEARWKREQMEKDRERG